MVRSMFSGVSGLKNHQTRMDVIANNIANVNTVAFKSSRVSFQDVYSQTIQGASAPSGTVGGTNPMQIGLGMSVASIDTLFTPAASQNTGLQLDLAIEGDGFFIVEDGSGRYYTRAGNFGIDSDGNIVVKGSGFFLLDGLLETPINTANHTEITINSNGEVTGLDASGTEQLLGTIAIAMFNNPAGLSKVGGNMYVETQNSGAEVIVQAGDGGSGYLRAGALELSNVDLANEFTDMITTQRGFQANSRIITTSDSMLEELVNLKR